MKILLNIKFGSAVAKFIILFLIFVLRAPAGVFSWTPDESLFSTVDRLEFKNIFLPGSGTVRLGPAQESLLTLKDAVLWDIVPDRKGNLYLGTGNQQTLYRFNLRTSKLSTVFSGDDGEIFTLLEKDNNIYFGTSPSGIIYRISTIGSVESLVNTGENYIHKLLACPDNSIIIATGPNGKLYRLNPGKGLELLFTFSSAHITALGWLKPGQELLAGTSPGGTVYRLEFSPTLARPKVTVLYDTPLEEVKDIISQGALIYLAANSDSGEEQPQPVVFAVDREGVLRWRWQCPESTVLRLVNFNGQLLALTGNRGLVYALDTLGRAAIWTRLNQPQVIATAVLNQTLYLGTGNPARLYRFIAGYADSGYLNGPVFDLQTPARFGRLDYRARIPNGTEIIFDTRSGNSQEPDSLWSVWEMVRGKVSSPPARFIQWRARLYSSYSQLTPELDRVDLYYQPVNRAPVITRLEISAPTENEARKGNPQPKRQISFEVQDPDSDSLIYQLYLQPEASTNPLLIEKELTETRYELDTRTIPDGWYRLKLVVSDGVDRGPQDARSVEKITAPFLVDNTPPEIQELKFAGNRASWIVTDRSSPIVNCRISLNAGNWQPVTPQDLVFDELQERFVFPLELRPGINTIAVWAVDALGNTGTAQLTVMR